jgi:hypothetical protein
MVTTSVFENLIFGGGFFILDRFCNFDLKKYS